LQWLDGLTATTFHGAIAQLASEFPRVKVVSGRRFVDNGKIITAAGLSAGIDGALHVVAKLSGLETARQVALNMEYDWQHEPSA
jgi:transcriptional regulator GlxA family with amidase domain